jgi:hypothetical protein
VVVDSVTKSVDLCKVVRKRDFRILPGKIRNDPVNGGRDFLKKGVIDKLKKAVERQLKMN